MDKQDSGLMQISCVMPDFNLSILYSSYTKNSSPMEKTALT